MSMCACMGPQNGEPLCPCQMRAARDYLPGKIEFTPHGCICPVGAEKTCAGWNCPRRPITFTGPI